MYKKSNLFAYIFVVNCQFFPNNSVSLCPLKLKIDMLHQEAVFRRCSVNKVFLEISQNSQENSCIRVSFLIKLQAEACNFIKKETLAQVFSCEFCEISKNTFSHRTPLVAASVDSMNNIFRKTVFLDICQFVFIFQSLQKRLFPKLFESWKWHKSKTIIVSRFYKHLLLTLSLYITKRTLGVLLH